MPTTPGGLPYPSLADVDNVPLFLGNLATALDQRIIVRAVSAAARLQLNVAAGTICYQTDTGQWYGYTAAGWVYLAGGTAGSSGWQNVNLAGFTHRSGQTVQYLRDSSGFVHFRGSMANVNTFPAPSALIFTLPVGFRPESALTVPLSTNTAPFNANLSIGTDGEAFITAFTGTTPAGRTFHMDGVTPFYAKAA